MCLCACSACKSPLLARVCGVGVCASALVSATPRHSWLGCWGLCVFVCALACTPQLLAGVCGVDVCVWACVSAAPRHSGWGVRLSVCVFVCAPCLYPATPGCSVRCGCLCLGSGFGCAPPLLAGVLGCVSVCVRSICTWPVLAGVRGFGVCAWARVSAAPCHSWLGCWGVCVFVCALRLYLAPLGWAVRCWCVCLGLGFGCAPPLLAGMFGCVCVCVRALPVPHHCWPRLCNVAVCVWARVSAASRHSWRGCWGVCVFVFAARFYPATSGWSVCCRRVCLGSGFGCVPRLLAGVFGPCLFVCSLRLHSTTPRWVVPCGFVCLGPGFSCARQLLPGVLGCVCVFVCSLPLYPCRSRLGCMGVWLGCCPAPVPVPLLIRAVRAARVCGTRRPMLLGDCPCALVVDGGVPLWRASWPRVGAPCSVPSGRSRCSGRLS